MDNKLFAERLRTLRGTTSQGDLAKILGVSRGSISFYENGDRTPDAEFIVAASSHFDVTADYLLGLSDYKSPDRQVQAQTIPLVDEALAFLNKCSKSQLQAINGILASEEAAQFLDALNTYIEITNTSPDGIPDNVKPFIDSISRNMSNVEFLAFLDRWRWDEVTGILGKIAESLGQK